MSARHLVTEYRTTRDRAAAARAGIAPTRDHDADPYYSSEEACWPDEDPWFRGVCATCACPVFHDGVGWICENVQGPHRVAG